MSFWMTPPGFGALTLLGTVSCPAPRALFYFQTGGPGVWCEMVAARLCLPSSGRSQSCRGVTGSL